MGTRGRVGMGSRELGAAACFLTSVGLGAWALPDAWWSGAVFGLGLGLLVAGFVHLVGHPGDGHARVASSRPVAARPVVRSAAGGRRDLLTAPHIGADDSADTAETTDVGWDPVTVHRTLGRQPAGRTARPGSGGRRGRAHA